MFAILLNVLHLPCTQIALRKSVRIQRFSGLYFPAFGLYTEIYRANLSIPSKCEKIRTRKTLNTGTFYAVEKSHMAVEEVKTAVHMGFQKLYTVVVYKD